MKKLYSIITMLTMIISALAFVSCESDDENDNGSNNYDYETIIVDGEEFRSGGYIKNGYLNIQAIKGMKLRHEMKIEINYYMLEIGRVFEDFTIYTYIRNSGEIALDRRKWRAIEGNFTIKDISNNKMKIDINNLVIYLYGNKHIFNGKAILDIEDDLEQYR